jgi:DNA-binding Lrp family transcriptional regulator
VASVDTVDFAIYRYLSPDGAARFWGCRRVIDPRVGAREIAARVGVSETAVRSRLRSLRERGYLADSAVWPNPSLFGVDLQVVEIPVAEVGAARALLDDLALVEGVTFARDVLDERDRKVQVYFVGESPAVIARRVGLLRRLAPGSELRGPRRYYVPEAARSLSPLDWRVVEAVRRAPEASLQQLSEALKVSLKTTGARYRSLLDARAVWWTHGAVSSELPLALLTATMEQGVDPDPVAARVSAESSGWIPVASNGRGDEPTVERTEFAGLLLAESPAAVESAAQKLLDLGGVDRVRRTFALGSRIYPGWFDDQVARRVRAAR